MTDVLNQSTKPFTLIGGEPTAIGRVHDPAVNYNLYVIVDLPDGSSIGFNAATAPTEDRLVKSREGFDFKPAFNRRYVVSKGFLEPTIAIPQPEDSNP